MSSDYASKVLGAALLQGWTMSAEECKREFCPGCPLMVSRDGKDSFCARCDGGEKVGLPRPGLVEPLATSLSSTLNSQTQVSSPTSSTAGDLLERDESHGTAAPETPPTPHSRLHSPPLGPALDLPSTFQTVNGASSALTMEQLARRQQADRASAILAQKMLQRWTLLGETCSNDACQGTPLMRRPPFQHRSREDGQEDLVTQIADPRRHCVVCQRDFVKEEDLYAYDEFMRVTTGQTASTSKRAPVGSARREESSRSENIIHSAAAKKRRFSKQQVVGGNMPSTMAPSTKFGSRIDPSSGRRPPGSEQTGIYPKIGTEELDVATRSSKLSPSTNANTDQTAPGLAIKSHQQVCSDETRDYDQVIHSALASLENAVVQLTQRLNDACTPPSLDPAVVAATAEALARTCGSLIEVRNVSVQI